MGQICTKHEDISNQDGASQQTGVTKSQLHQPKGNSLLHYSNAHLQILRRTAFVVPVICRNQPKNSFFIIPKHSEQGSSVQIREQLAALTLADLVQQATDQLRATGILVSKGFQSFLTGLPPGHTPLRQVVDILPLYFDAVEVLEIATGSGAVEENASQSKNALERFQEVNVVTLQKKQHTFRVLAADSVLDLKEKIALQLGIEVERQQLFRKGQLLADSRYFAEGIVPSNGVVHLIVQSLKNLRDARTGKECAFYQPSQEQRCGESFPLLPHCEDASAHRRVSAGLNFEGVCENAQCAVFGQRVIIDLKTEGTEQPQYYDFVNGTKNGTCPTCKQNNGIQIQYVGVSRCRYAIAQARVKGDRIERVTAQQVRYVGSDAYVLIAPPPPSSPPSEADKNVSYKVLVNCQQWSARKDGTELNLCAVCCQPVLDTRVQRTCQHLYHRACWDDVSATFQKDCLLCMMLPCD